MSRKHFLITVLFMVIAVTSSLWSAAEQLRPVELKSVGEKPPKQKNIDGPRRISFGIPKVGEMLNLSVKLGQPKAPFQVLLYDKEKKIALRLILSSPARIRKYDITKIVKHKPGKGSNFDDEKSMALIKSPETAMSVILREYRQIIYDMPYFTKPNLNFYIGETQRNLKYFRFFRKMDKSVFDDRKKAIEAYPKFPSALEKMVDISLERTKESLSLWLDGRFLKEIPNAKNIVSGELDLAKGNVLQNTYTMPSRWHENYLMLDLADYARPGNYKFKPSITGIKNNAVNDIKGVPVFCGNPQKNIDVGLSRWLGEKIEPFDFFDVDGARHAFDGCPESIILQIPKENFTTAYVLCAVAPDSKKDAVLTLRASRFQGRGRGEAYADTTVYLPRNASGLLPKNVIKAGEISSENGKTKLPVYLVSIPLKLGEISDLLGENSPDSKRRGNGYLDLELTKAVRLARHYYIDGMFREKPLGKQSAVHVFGITLERSPVDVRITSDATGNIFYAQDNPCLKVHLQNCENKDESLSLIWKITDYYKKTKNYSKNIELSAAGKKVVDIPLKESKLGYFDITVTLKDKSGKVLWEQPASFALLPPDTRKAGNESPYGTWWFAGENGTCGDIKIVGPLMKKMGIRHIPPLYQVLNKGICEKDLQPYNLTYTMLPMVNPPKKGRKNTTITYDQINEFIKKNPSVRIAQVFWERSIPGIGFPPELSGKQKPELKASQQDVFKQYWKFAEKWCNFFRKEHPNMKISFGNSRPGLMIQFMRHGFPKKYIDYFGLETEGGDYPPELTPRYGAIQEAWIMQEMQRLYGYEDIPLTAACEYIHRSTNKGGLTEREQSDYFVRDSLQNLAYGFDAINPGTLCDAGDGYYYTKWGAGGFLHRYPLFYPKPSYVSYATMTRILDGAKYARYLDTGSHSLYVLEFKKDNSYIYAFWTLRGKRPMTIFLDSSEKVFYTDCMGNTDSPEVKDKKVELTATTAPAYLQTSEPIAKIIPGKPEYDIQISEAHQVIKIAGDLVKRRGDNCDLEVIDDPDQGKVTQITVNGKLHLPKTGRYSIYFNFKKPLVIKKKVSQIGFWVKGNSSWSQLSWSFKDANGEMYSMRVGYKYKNAINYDGWRLLVWNIPKRYLGCDFHGPYDKTTWWYSGGDEDGNVQFPIAINRIEFIMRDWQVYVKDMLPVKDRTICLGNIVLIE